jgi:hypothetical protein
MLYQALLSGLLTLSIFFGRIKNFFLSRRKRAVEEKEED